MRLLNPGEPEPLGYFPPPKKSHEFSPHEREVILQMAQGDGYQIEQMNETEISKLIERLGNEHAYCLDPENYPPEIVQIFEGMYTVPLYLMVERAEEEYLQSLTEDGEQP